MNNFTYFNDEWNSPIVEGTSQPLPASLSASPLNTPASPLMENSPITK